MRQIKFKAKIKFPEDDPRAYSLHRIKHHMHNGQWIEGDLHTRCAHPHIHSQYDTVAPIDLDTVCEFTGLQDKNGKDIYEGDIVQLNEFVYEVGYDDKRFASFVLLRKQDVFKHYFGEALEANQVDIIGNIHDNPELLKED